MTAANSNVDDETPEGPTEDTTADESSAKESADAGLPSSHSVSQWIRDFRHGDESGFQKIWERYYEQVITLVRRLLANKTRRVADEEDFVSEAFARLAELIKQGRFPPSSNRGDLWRLLITIAAGKLVDHIRRELAAKRGGGTTRGDSVFEDGRQGVGFDQIVGSAPDPALAAQLAEEFERVLKRLSELQRNVLNLYLGGIPIAEIAEQLDISEAQVEYILRLIRKMIGGA